MRVLERILELKDYMKNIADAARGCEYIDRVILFGSSTRDTCKEESDIDSFLDGYVGELFEERITGLDDFELICFLVIK